MHKLHTEVQARMWEEGEHKPAGKDQLQGQQQALVRTVRAQQRKKDMLPCCLPLLWLAQHSQPGTPVRSWNFG